MKRSEKIAKLMREAQEQKHLQEEIAKVYAFIAAQVRVIAEQELKKFTGLSIKQIAKLDNLSYGTVRARVKEMQSNPDFAKYVRDYGGYINGAYKQCLRIDLEGWRAYGTRHVTTIKHKPS